VIVVSGTTPLNYLVQMGLVEILPQVYGPVYIPRAVLEELLHVRTPDIVRKWASEPPRWIIIRDAQASAVSDFEELDRGERDALELAVLLGADTVLLDDLEARLLAVKAGLHVTGTVTVLAAAANAGRLDFDQAIEKLRGLGFRVSDEVVERVRLAKT
jgi:predicted nucleic acid-binding protein